MRKMSDKKLPVPDCRETKFYQCVNFNCEKLEREYIYKDGGKLIPISKNIPFILEKPVVYGKICWNKYIDAFVHHIFGQ